MLLQLVAVQGETNDVLVSASIGDAPNAVAFFGEPLAGSFQLASVVPTNVLAGAATQCAPLLVSIAE